MGPFKTVYQQVPSLFFMSLSQIVLVLHQTLMKQSIRRGSPSLHDLLLEVWTMHLNMVQIFTKGRGYII